MSLQLSQAPSPLKTPEKRAVTYSVLAHDGGDKLRVVRRYASDLLGRGEDSLYPKKKLVEKHVYDLMREHPWLFEDDSPPDSEDDGATHTLARAAEPYALRDLQPVVSYADHLDEDNGFGYSEVGYSDVAASPLAGTALVPAPRRGLKRATKDKPVVYAGCDDDDTDKDKSWLVGEDGSGCCLLLDDDESPLKKPKVATSTRASCVPAIDCAECEYEAAFGKRSKRLVHTCARANKNMPKGPVGKCMLTGKDKWSFVADVVFMTKGAVPKVLNRPGCHGRRLLKQDTVHFQIHHVYKTTDAENNIVYWAHEGSL